MISRSMVRRALGLCIAGAATACANASNTMGNDPSSRTTASAVTWSDGKPAISISCEQPGGCQTRAVAMCKGPNYTVLNMENMPNSRRHDHGARRRVGRHPLQLRSSGSGQT